MLLQANFPSMFKHLQQAHLLAWTKDFVENGCNVKSLVTNQRIFSSIDNAHIIHKEFSTQIDCFVLILIASKCELNAVLIYSPLFFILCRIVMEEDINI